MPKVNLDRATRESERFSDYVRGELRRSRKRQIDLAVFLGLPQQAISQRLMGQIDWRLKEMSDVCNYFETTFTLGEKK